MVDFDKVTSLFSFSAESSSLVPKLYEGVPTRFSNLYRGTENFLNILQLSLPEAEPATPAGVPANEDLPDNIVSLDEYRTGKAARAGQVGAEAAVQRLALEGQHEAMNLQRLSAIAKWEAENNERTA